jgi:hypothetical protein
VWPTNQRIVEAPDTDRLGVEVTYHHDWLTGFFADSTDFTMSTEFQLEPEVFGPGS